MIINKEYRIWRYNISFDRWSKKDKNQPMGRFGGGWNYVLGIQFGKSSLIINLLYGMIRINKKELK